SPMFMQWSISARGAYIEILLWGTLLLWSYTEWFTGPALKHLTIRRRILFGLLIGSGLWLNPAIIVFIVPMVLHALLDQPLKAAREHATLRPVVNSFATTFGRTSALVVALAAILTLNLIWSVWVAD